MMRILVYGAGKTGTTAVYYAFQNASPGMTCVFEPPTLSKIDFAEHPDLLVKSLAVMKHAQEAQYFPWFDKRVLIVRHPFDRLVSYVLYAPNNGQGFFDDRAMQSFVDLLKRKLASPGSVSFREIVELVSSLQPGGMHAPVKALEAIADNYPEFHLLRYEDFVDGKLDELNRYSGFTLTSDPEISGKQQKVVRSKDYGDWHKWFLQSDVDHFREIYDSVLKRFGYDTTLQEVEPLNEATTVAYSIKVANQGRRIRWLPEYVAGEINMTSEGQAYQEAKQALIHGDLKQAEKMVSEAVTASPHIAGLHHLQFQVLYRLGDYAAAAEALRRAIAIIPTEPKFHHLLGVALRRAGHEAEAVAALKKARTLEAAA